jgi:pentatricopeptide repeat protein
MHSDGLTGNHPLYHGLLLACGAAGEWEAALETFLGMQVGRGLARVACGG